MACKQFREVFEDEEQSVKERRFAAGLTTEALPEADDDDNFPRTGLALSGGGIRSASFGLGFLQAMYERGVLRQIDYLSTVSGGSYVGCFLSSSVADRRNKDKPITRDPSGDDLTTRKFVELQPDRPPERIKAEDEVEGGEADEIPLSSCAYRDQFESELSLLPKKSAPRKSEQPGTSQYEGAYNDDLMRLTKAGETLNRPLPFFNRLLLGMLLINITAFSGIIAIAALFAIAYRLLNEPLMMSVLAELGFSGDVFRPLFPVAILFVVWLITSYCSRERTLRDLKIEGRWRQINNAVFLLLVASILMSTASLLTVADASMPLLESQVDGEKATQTRQSATSWLSVLSHLAVAGIIAALVPYIRPKALIQSGFDPHSPTTHKWVFNIASRALLYGVPLLVFGLLCQENISKHHQRRDDRYEFAPMSIANWHSFWQRVEMEAIGEENPPLSPSATAQMDSLWGQWWNQKKNWLLKSFGLKRDEGISRHLWNVVQKKSDSPTIERSIRRSERIDARTHKFHILKIWNPTVAFSLWNPFTLAERINEREDNLRWRDEFTDLLNEQCLADPGLYRYFRRDRDAAGDTRDQTFVTHYEHARDLESTAMAYVLDTKAKQSPNEPLWGLQSHIDALKVIIADRDREDEHAEARNTLQQFKRLQAEIQKTNWDLLRSHYGADIRSYDTIFSYVVLKEDQQTRLVIAACFGVLFLILGFLVPLNDISIHRYYRDQLAKVWMNPIGAKRHDARIDKVETVNAGFPYHLVNATLHSFAQPEDAALFVFSPKYCGSHETGFADTGKYGADVNYADAMAVSGAAVSPMATRNPLVRVLLFLGNFRLGRWVPNPGMDSDSQFPATPLPTMWNTLLRDTKHQRFCFVTDGGVADNTGIASLLHRRCRVIIAVDASQDGESHFHDLLRLMETQRITFGRTFSGVRFKTSQGDFSINDDQPLDIGKPPERERIPLNLIQEERSHFVVIEVTYPVDRYATDAGLANTQTGYIIYIKPSFDGDESAELVQYCEVNKSFPHDPTYDQFFDTQKFEKYRELGRHIGEEVWTHLFQDFAKINRQPNKDGLSPPWLSHWDPEQVHENESESEPPKEAKAETEPKPDAPTPQAEADPEHAATETDAEPKPAATAETETEPEPATANSETTAEPIPMSDSNAEATDQDAAIEPAAAPTDRTNMSDLGELMHRLYLPQTSIEEKLVLLRAGLKQDDGKTRLTVCGYAADLIESQPPIEDRRKLCVLLIQHANENPDERDDVIETIVQALKTPGARHLREVKAFFDGRE